MKILLSSLLLFAVMFCADTNAQGKKDIKNQVKQSSKEIVKKATVAEDKAAIRKVIDKLFAGMKAGDSKKVREVFNPNARLNTSAVDPEGNGVLYVGGLEPFLEAVGGEHDEVWNEKITSTEIQIDDNLAHVWAEYEFYLGKEFLHCGVNSFQLVKLEGEWTIVNLIDTKRTADKCK